MIEHFSIRFILSLILFFLSSTSISSEAFSFVDLENLIKNNPEHKFRYREVRESPWLQTPLISTGVMNSLPPVLEKHVEEPRQDVWRLYPDYMEWFDPNSSVNKKIYFSQSPQVAVLANAIRSVVSGQLSNLVNDFNSELIGDADNWNVKLSPRSDISRRYLSAIEFSGSRMFVKKIVVKEPLGEVTTTTLGP